MSSRDSSSVLARLRESHPHFHPRAFAFALDSMELVVSSLQERRHISGAELAEGAMSLAIDRYGPIARTVLEHWGIRSTADLGEVVFALVEAGLLVKRDEDSADDFEGVLDFDTVLDEEYPWMVASREHLGRMMIADPVPFDPAPSEPK